MMKRTTLLTAAVLLAGGVGCQRYERAPLGLAGHREAFMVRTPESPEVAAFAAALREHAPPLQAFNPTDGVDLGEAEAIALVFNADLRMARLRAGVSAAGAAHAGLWEDPVIGVDLARVIESVSHPWKIAGTLGLTIPISGRLRAETRLAGMKHAADLAAVAEREWRTRMEVRRTWARWSAARARAGTMREFLERMDGVLVVVDLMERGGELARTEARLFRIERTGAAATLAELAAAEADEQRSISRLMGLSPESALRLSDAEWPEAPEPRDLLSSSPLLAVAVAEYEVAESSLLVEIRKQYPDLGLDGGVGREDGESELLLGFRVPLPVLNANRRGIAEARAARELARAAAETALEGLLNEHAAATAAWGAAAANRRMLENELVPLVDAQYADARRVAELGEVNTLVMLESLSRQQEAKMRLIEARRDEQLALVRIQELIGPGRTPETNPMEQP